MTIEGEAQRLEPPFMVLATQNPIEHEGTYPLPEAQLDRFLLKIRIDYPTPRKARLARQVTLQIASASKLDVEEVRTLVKPETVVELQRDRRALALDDAVLDYAVRIVRATRTWNGVAAGAGPRGGIALVRAARAAALIDRPRLCHARRCQAHRVAGLRHRVTPAPELQIEGQDSDTILTALLDNVEAPRA